MIVVDTHVFLWYAMDDPKLDSSLKETLFKNASSIYVPSVCFWELMLLYQCGRITLESEPEAMLRRFLKESGFTEAPLTAEIAVLSRTLPFDHSDPADRFIAATAYAKNCQLATSDGHLRSLPWLHLAY